MKTLFLLLIGLTLFATTGFAQVSVTATAGTAGPTAYTTLKGAFDAINAGTHQGAITISITGDTTETASAALNASGAGAASYTSVLVQPTGGARTITGSIVGGVIKLNGADNVTIDGRTSPFSTARNLTVSNTNGSSSTGGIWLASVAAGNGASNNVIRNLEIAGGGDQQAAAAATFGIIQTGTLMNVTNTTGNDNDNNSFIANRIVRVRYGIASRGVEGNNNVAPVITDNIIGPAAFGPDQIGRAGIYMTGDTGAIISRNTIQNVGVRVGDGAAGADRFGIAIGAQDWDAADGTVFEGGDYTVTKNVIHDIVDEKEFSAVGIRLGTTRNGAATNNLVANNFIYNIRSNGDQVCGIGYANGHTDRIVFNSISLTGDMDPIGSSGADTYGNAIRISQANGPNNANLTLMNNSIYLDVFADNTVQSLTVRFYAITANSAAYSFGTGGLNYNNYFINAANGQLRTGGLDTGAGDTATTEFATLANWKTAFTAPQDANSIQADPLYVSNTSDLRIPGSSPNVDAGVAIAGVTDDIDEHGRVNPDIGADEFRPSSAVFNLPTGDGNNQAILEDNSNSTDKVSQLRSQNGTFSTTQFHNPAGSLTVNYGNDGETLTYAQLDPAFNPSAFPRLNGGGGDDRLLLDFASGTNVIPANFSSAVDLQFDAAGGADGIVLLPGYNAGFIGYFFFQNAQDVNIGVEGRNLKATGLDSSIGISDQLNAGDRSLNFDLNANLVILDTGFAVNDGFSRIRTSPETSVQTDFRNPTSSLTINLAEGNDSITVLGFDAVGAPPTATFNGGGGDDTFHITASTATATTIDGGETSETATGDTLNYDAQGGAVTRNPPTGESGTITVPGFATLTFSNIENVNIIPGVAPTPTPTPTPSPGPTTTPSPGATPTPTASPGVTPTPTPVTTLANISTRLRVETGDNVLIGGFIITGTQPKTIIVRGIGTSLPLADKLANPTLELHGPNGLIEANDNWVDSPNKQAIIDTTIPPTSDLEAAIVQTLPANNTGYTAIVRGANNSTGIGVVEAYDLDTTVDSRLANISTRGFVQTDDNVLIAGTIIVGQATQTVLVRGIGPSLTVPGKMENPTLELRDSNGALLQANDNWVDSPNKQAIIDTTIPPTNDLESAIIATLPSNTSSYTAILRGANNTTGIAVVEIYALQ